MTDLTKVGITGRTALALAVVLAAVAPGAPAAGGRQIELQADLITAGLAEPIGIAQAGDARLFVLERAGRIRIVSDGTLQPVPFLDITALVESGFQEQGLLGLAFHPDFPAPGHFYVDYTDLDGNTVVARFSVSGDPDLADPNSQFVLLTVDQPFANHNGGCLRFGPDGMLYIGLGDGGSAGDPGDRAQDLETLLGKILRIDVDGGNPYAIPPDNPFAGQPPARPEIWAYGLRNPWRFSFDRATGALLIGDVGQFNWEEVDFEPPGSGGGRNYGWRCYEGNHEFNTLDCGPPGGYVFPVFEYAHAAGRCSVTGGHVYRGSQVPGLTGRYLVADYCTGEFWSMSAAGGWTPELHGSLMPDCSTIDEDADGELVAASLSAGAIYRLRDAAPSPTSTPAPSATPTSGPTGTPAPTPPPGLGVRIELPTVLVHPGQQFHVQGWLDNPGSPLAGVPVVFVLNYLDAYWFWPSWVLYQPPQAAGFDFRPFDLTTGTTPVEVVPAFAWPETGGQAVSGLRFYGALLSAGFDAILGDFAQVEWGYGPTVR